MRELDHIPAKKIIASEAQALINLKLRYNALVDKINTNNISEDEKESLLREVRELNIQITFYS